MRLLAWVPTIMPEASKNNVFIFMLRYLWNLVSLPAQISDIIDLGHSQHPSFPPLSLVVLGQRICDWLSCCNMSLSDFGEFPFCFWGILFLISGIFILRYTHCTCFSTFYTITEQLFLPHDGKRADLNYVQAVSKTAPSVLQIGLWSLTVVLHIGDYVSHPSIWPVKP